MLVLAIEIFMVIFHAIGYWGYLRKKSASTA
jgi:hypothetical protein